MPSMMLILRARIVEEAADASLNAVIKAGETE